MRKFIILFLAVLLTAPSVSAREKIMEIQFGLGSGFYLGSFRDHLKTDGAYTATPVLDLYFSPYLHKNFGFSFYLGTGAVIHPQSKPIEGVILYIGTGPFYTWSKGRFHMRFTVLAGYQHPGMSLQWYGSGFFGLGCFAGWDLNDYSCLRIGVDYKRQFLRSLIIHEKYDSLSENDNLNSLAVTAGYAVYFRTVSGK